jgi:predicted enzyme related to lactoylglutathione lyase
MNGKLTPPDGGTVNLTITFFYYRNLAAAMRFYEDVMGFALAIDQEWSKIYRIGGDAHVGLVDEARGMNKWAPVKPVQLCIRVPDVDAWYDYAKARAINCNIYQATCSRAAGSMMMPPMPGPGPK